MPEPFVFHFKPGPGGRPEILYMLDLDCQCGLCGHEQFQRFYHSTPFHSLTLPGLEDLLSRGPLKAGYECENCGDAVGANQVRNAALIYGFCDDSGVLRVFEDLQKGRRRWESTARRRLDPQVIPRWSADPEAFADDHRVADDLDESDIEQLFGRPFNIKIAIRDLLDQWDGSPLRARLCDGFYIVIAADQPTAQTIAVDDERGDERGDENLVALSLHDSRPDGLPTHSDPSQMVGRWATWLPDEIVDAISHGDIWIEVYLSATAAVDVIERTFEVGRLSFDRREQDGGIYGEITTPRGAAFDGELSVLSVLRRAAFTGITPGEAARLSAEEIVADLLGLW